MPEVAGPGGAGDLLAGAAWRCAPTAPDAVAHPRDLPADLAWLPAPVPGTSAGAVRDARGRAAALALDHDAHDWWFTTTLPAGAPAGSVLVLPGLATVAEVFCGDEPVATTRSMFATVEVELAEQAPGAVLALRCRALAAELGVRRPRGRWRSSLVAAQGLRHLRTTLLGRAPVLAGAAAPVGPWRGVALHPPTQVRVAEQHLQASLEGTTGMLRARLRLAGVPAGPAELTVGDVTVGVAVGPGGAVEAEVRLPGVARWWPWTHGEPVLHAAALRVVDPRGAGLVLDLGPVGFRTVTADRSGGGFRLVVNDVAVFARGAVWAPLDPVGHAPDPAGTRAVLATLVAAGLNTVRVPGTDVDPGEDFHRACAAAGVLVWQDVALATLDPVADGEVGELLRAEVAALARARAADPSLVVVSGGTETEQQPTLLGLPADARALPVLDALAAVVAEHAPGVVTVTSSPSGGALPTHVGSGVAHWFGVGAYLRPLRDVREAGVRFAAECLAFATPPDPAAVERHFGSAAPAGHHPDWKAGVPRDRGSSWDFEDVRDHYVRTALGVEPSLVRRSDPEHALDLGRAAVCTCVEEVLTWWRRPRSGSGGGLVLTALDLAPGAGWGLLDVDRDPKAPWYVLRRVCAPLALLLSDDGLDGVGLDLRNDGPEPVAGRLVVRAHRADGVAEELVDTAVVVPAHGGLATGVDELTGRFTDLTHAHGFGPRTWDAVTAELRDPDPDPDERDADAAVLAAATWLAGGPARPREADAGLTAELSGSAEDGWFVTVGTRASAQWVVIDSPGHDAADSWFHLAAGTRRRVALRPREGARSGRAPGGRVRALSSVATATIRDGV